MVSKETLIRKLDNATELEDKGVKLITRLLMARVEKSSLRGDKKRRLVEIAETLRNESGEHRDGAKELLNKIGRLEQDEL